MENAGRSEQLDAAVEVRQAAWKSVRRAHDVDAVLASLYRVLPYDDALLSRWDPLAKKHVHVAGSMPHLASDFIQRDLHRDPLFDFAKKTGSTLWLSSLTPEQRRSSPTVRRVVEPLGYAEGVTQCLHTSEGNYAGVLNLGMRRIGPELEDAKKVLALLFDSLAAAVDACPALDGSTAQEWVVVVPDRTDHGVVAGPSFGPISGFPIVEVVRRGVRTRRLPATLLVPFRGSCVEVRLQRVEEGTRALCRVGDFASPLSWREIEVLSEIARGRTNHEIAACLVITSRTVACHVEHILAKLGVPNRAAAASYAVSLGLDLAPREGRALSAG